MASNKNSVHAQKPGKSSQDLIGELCESLEKSHDDFLFACGGSVPIYAFQQPGKNSDAPSCIPFTLRWDSPNPSTPNSHCKLAFPIEPYTSDNLARLVADMAPEGTDRKALKFDSSQFSTNFSPYECGIVDAIAQLQLPLWKAAGDTYKGVRAELHELNVSAGRSDGLGAYTDIPRSKSHLGSLVICLPVAHQGGQLEVRHKDKSMTFDWSGMKASEPAIQWAAFYRGCEREVLELQSGHRITLTYNLYAVRGNGQLASHCNVIDPTKIPLYKHIHELLHTKSYSRKGGYLGFYTTHSYPHTSNGFCAPENLRGVDMALWECFKALECDVCVRPVASYLHPDFVMYDDGAPMPSEFIGDSFPVMVDENGAYQGDNYMKMLRDWSGLVFGRKLGFNNVEWLNEPDHKELQIAFTVGQFTEEAYSSCAIIVRYHRRSAA